ncbi:hypothetical protein RND71_024477 [Anisodus tanguticus]|uniref:Uncharacterized protein n=1 Tax=Anisodus tanguticus TaxID=243964 RepID=A0AAE1RR77_9SOLA|nr:hypothetical protein RND71_024477 [Anisodus tanguticus]
MKRAMPWSDNEEEDTSSDDSSTLDTDTDDNLGSSKHKSSQVSKKGIFELFGCLRAPLLVPWVPVSFNRYSLFMFISSWVAVRVAPMSFFRNSESAKRKSKGVDFEALSRHGYKGGLSVLKVPPPKEPDQEQNWSWSSGKETREKEKEETYEERQKTRAALEEAEQLVHARTQKERKNISFSQKEKRKRDLGQASRGKSYVEEEKRLLRDNGVYSGFDS